MLGSCETAFSMSDKPFIDRCDQAVLSAFMSCLKREIRSSRKNYRHLKSIAINSARSIMKRGSIYFNRCSLGYKECFHK